MERMTGGCGRGLINLDLHLLITLQTTTNISTPLEMNSVLLFLKYIYVSCPNVGFSWYFYYASPVIF